MPVALTRMKFWLAAIGSVVALAIAVLPATASASTSPYCGGWKGPWGGCEGAGRQLYQVYGWGDQASVCVYIVHSTGYSCSSGAGSGVYSGQLPFNVTDIPAIKNNSGVNNFLHGVAFTH
jgi:hypothetical protein